MRRCCYISKTMNKCRKEHLWSVHINTDKTFFILDLLRAVKTFLTFQCNSTNCTPPVLQRQYVSLFRLPLYIFLICHVAYSELVLSIIDNYNYLYILLWHWPCLEHSLWYQHLERLEQFHCDLYDRIYREQFCQPV